MIRFTIIKKLEAAKTRLQDWLMEHQRIGDVIFLVFVVMNAWASYYLFRQYPLFALPNAVVALLLVLFVVLTW